MTDTSHFDYAAAQERYAAACDDSIAAYNKKQPFVVYGASLKMDGNSWCAILGDLPTGVAAFGASPEEAVQAFNKEWYKKASQPAKKEG